MWFGNSEDRKFLLKILKYSFIFAITTCILIFIAGYVTFHTLFEVTKPIEAVQMGGAGNANLEMIQGELDVESGCIYLKATDTPLLGRHPGHGVIYIKSNGKLYFLFDNLGEQEHEISIEE